VGYRLLVLIMGEEWVAVVDLTVKPLIREVGQASNSEMRSSACKSSLLTHELWASE
jgi:hypothetical protein